MGGKWAATAAAEFNPAGGPRRGWSAAGAEKVAEERRWYGGRARGKGAPNRRTTKERPSGSGIAYRSLRRVMGASLFTLTIRLDFHAAAATGEGMIQQCGSLTQLSQPRKQTSIRNASLAMSCAKLKSVSLFGFVATSSNSPPDLAEARQAQVQLVHVIAL